MRLRTKFVWYLTVIHLVFAAAAWHFLQDHRNWTLALEGFFILSFITGFSLLRSLFEPLRLINSGIDLIKAHDFGTRFKKVGQPELDPLIQVYNAMAEHLHQERVRSQEQEHFLQQIIAVSPSGILTLDLDDHITLCNPGAARLLGLGTEALLGKTLADLGTPFTAQLADLKPEETQLLSLRGRYRVRVRCLSFLDRGFARRFLLLDEMTEEIHQSEKAAYEKLIRMMSHEVNNTVGGVSSLLESCLAYGDQLSSDDQADFIQAVSVALSRTGHMNQFMQDFADVVRLPAPHCRPSDLRALLQDMAMVLKDESTRRQVTWTWDLPADLPDIALDPVQMEQAILNICRNGLQAMDDGGVLAVSANVIQNRVCLQIADDGCGIPPDFQAQIFTPFFTSKDKGQGIGLTLVQEILLGHGCDYSLDNRPDRGSVFTIRFPA